MEWYVKTPEDFYKLHNFVTLMADVMTVNGNPFLITPERKLKLVWLWVLYIFKNYAFIFIIIAQ